MCHPGANETRAVHPASAEGDARSGQLDLLPHVWHQQTRRVGSFWSCCSELQGEEEEEAGREADTSHGFCGEIWHLLLFLSHSHCKRVLTASLEAFTPSYRKMDAHDTKEAHEEATKMKELLNDLSPQLCDAVGVQQNHKNLI